MIYVDNQKYVFQKWIAFSFLFSWVRVEELSFCRMRILVPLEWAF